jgi:hypothetical protein
MKVSLYTFFIPNAKRNYETTKHAMRRVMLAKALYLLVFDTI